MSCTEQQAAEERVQRMMLVIEAMWELLEDHGHTDDELQARIDELIERRGRQAAASWEPDRPTRASRPSSPRSRGSWARPHGPTATTGAA